jgi:hypothetical protein
MSLARSVAEALLGRKIYTATARNAGDSTYIEASPAAVASTAMEERA